MLQYYTLSRFLIQALEAKAKEEVEKRKEEAEAKLTMQVSALNENVATLKREWQSSQRRVSELEKQTDELRGEIAVLEATVQNNQDERRALLERLGTAHLPFYHPFSSPLGVNIPTFSHCVLWCYTLDV